MITLNSFKEISRRVIIIILANFFYSNLFAQLRQVHVDNAHPDNHAYKISFYSPVEGYVAFLDYVGYTTDSGRTFTQKPITLNNVNYNGYTNINVTFGFGIAGIKAFDKNTLIVYGDYGKVPAILRSTDGGSHFTLVYYSQFDPLILYQGVKDMVFPGNGNTGYAIDADRILKTTNNGQTWSAVYTQAGAFFTNLNAVDDDLVYTVSTSAGNVLLRTTNAGNKWTPVDLPAVQNPVIFYTFFLTFDNGWMSVGDGDGKKYIYKTTNGGSSWALKNNVDVTPFSCTKMKFTDINTGYAVSSTTVYKTTNSGANWEPLIDDNSGGFDLYDMQFINANQFWAGGQHGFLELSTNAGGIPKPVASFAIDTAGFAATNTINLVNYSNPANQFKWFVNGVQVSTSYNTSYQHDIYHATDTVKLVAANAAGTGANEIAMYIKAVPKPVITSFSPASGTPGDVITIKGAYLLSAIQVDLGGEAVASFKATSSDSLQVVVGDGETGSVHVTTTGGEDALPGFTFIPPPPIITAISPAKAAPGTVITITGKFFLNTIAVAFGGAPAAKFKILSKTKATAVVSTGATGSVSITTNKGSGSLAGFVFIPPVTVSSFSPASGPTGTVVTINGSNFNTTAASNIVLFGGVRGNVTAATSTQLTVIVPAGATYQPITVTTKNQTVATKIPFTVTFNGGAITSSSFVKRSTYDVAEGSSNNSQGSLGDLDGDGKLDIVTANDSYTGLYSIFRNISDASGINFAPRIDSMAPTGEINAIVRDMNMDGLPDIVLSSGGVRVVVNKSTQGHIATELVALPLEPASYGLSVGDIDGDGRPDILAITSVGENNMDMAILRNTSQGSVLSFEEAITPLAGNESIGCELADVDGDGKPELIYTNYYDGTVAVCKNTSIPGNISFYGPVYVNVPGAWKVAAADIDGDGKLDLGVAQHSDLDDMSALLNTSTGPGDIAFGPAIKFGTRWGSNLQFADMNGDGKPDIIAPHDYLLVSIYENKSTPGAIAFSKAADFTGLGRNDSKSVPAGDLNNDGKPDFVYVNYSDGQIAIFENVMQGSLPVTLVDFTATKLKNEALLKWQTATEQNSSHFNIQRSTDAVHFTNIGKVEAAGSSTVKKEYNYTDNIGALSSHPIIYYRLEEVDKDGKSMLSKIASINMAGTEIKVFITPNPVKNRLAVQLNYSGKATITIFDMAGRKLQQVENTAVQGNTVYFNTSSFAAGTYIVSANVDGKVIQQKFVKQ